MRLFGLLLFVAALLNLLTPRALAQDTLESIEIIPLAHYFDKLGEIHTYRAIAFYSSGDFVDPYTNVTWEIEDQFIARLRDDPGEVVAVSKGSTKLIARSLEDDSISAEAGIYVLQKPNRLTMNPTSRQFDQIGQTQSFSVTAHFPDFTTEPYDSVGWTIESSAVATVSFAGEVTSQGIGTTHVYATSTEFPELVAQGLVTVSLEAYVSSLEVLPSSDTLDMLGNRRQFRAVATLADDRVIDPYTDVVWSVGDRCVASIDSSGQATARGGGSTSITARVAGSSVSGNATLTVNALPKVDWLELTPESYTFLSTGEEHSFSARAYFCQGGSEQGFDDVNWSTSNDEIAVVNGNGKVTAVGEGTASIRATAQSYPGVFAESEVTVLTGLSVDARRVRDWLLGSLVFPTPADANSDSVRDVADLVWIIKD